MHLPIVAVIGRPNVGKSTLVNRIAETSEAIVHEERGVTRDRSYHCADWLGREFMVVDTGGIEGDKGDPFAESVTAQALLAAKEADVVVFLVDGTTGVTTGDAEVATRLKQAQIPILLAVNKMDTPGRDDAIHEFWSLGLGEPWPVSATHGHGTGDLLDAIVEGLPPPEAAIEADAIDVAIIGKPNAGKSLLLNRLTGSERAIVSEIPGTTRDALDVLVRRDAGNYRFIDTAGIRRRARIEKEVEYYSFVRAMRAIDSSDVALLVVDSTSGITDQDQRVARFAAERGCGLVVLLNKWDLVDDPEWRDEIAYQLGERLGFVSYAPVLRISALTGTRIGRIFDTIDMVWANYTKQLPTSALNRVLTEMRDFGHTVTKGSRTLRLHYVTQTHTEPPGFTFFANHPSLVDDSFRRYVENRLREAFDLTGTPILLKFKPKE